jgi:hypothetical protein
LVAVGTAWAVVVMRFSTSSGWETMATWLVETSMVVAPMRPPNCRCSSGWSPYGRSSRSTSPGTATSTTCSTGPATVPSGPPPGLPGSASSWCSSSQAVTTSSASSPTCPSRTSAASCRCCCSPPRSCAGWPPLHLRKYARHRRPPRTAQRWPAPTSHHLRRIPDDPCRRHRGRGRGAGRAPLGILGTAPHPACARHARGMIVSHGDTQARSWRGHGQHGRVKGHDLARRRIPWSVALSAAAARGGRGGFRAHRRRPASASVGPARTASRPRIGSRRPRGCWHPDNG